MKRAAIFAALLLFAGSMWGLPPPAVGVSIELVEIQGGNQTLTGTIAATPAAQRDRPPGANAGEGPPARASPWNAGSARR